MCKERMDSLLRLALKYNVSEIIFDNKYSETSIRMKFDLEERKVKAFDDDNKLIDYLASIGGITIPLFEHFEPQVSQFPYKVDGKTLQLRYALIDSSSYRNAVLRILK